MTTKKTGQKPTPSTRPPIQPPPSPDRPDHERLPQSSLEAPPLPEPSGTVQLLLQLTCPQCETPIYQPLLHRPAPPFQLKPVLPLPCSVRCWCCESVILL